MGVYMLKRCMGLQRAFIHTLILFCLPSFVKSQEVKASLSFLVDTTAVGKPIGLRVAVAHPKEMAVIFPGRKKQFAPFEYVTREAVPTRTFGGISYDTAIYQLRTFELEEFQSLQLPIGYVLRGDTFEARTGTDSIRLNYRYKEGVSAEEFRAIALPIEMTDPPNYTLIILFGIAAIVFLIGLFFVIREPVLKRLKLRKNKKQFEEALFKLRSVSGIQDTERQVEIINQLWKEYLDPEEEHRLKALTTHELEEELLEMHHLGAEHRLPLLEASTMYDKAVYAGAFVHHEEVNDLMVALLPVFELEYLRRKEIISQER